MNTAIKNIFVFGADDFNLQLMQALPNAEQYRFHPLLRDTEVKLGLTTAVQELHEKALEQLACFDGSVDAIVGYWDFPVSTLLPLLRQVHDLPSPSLEAVLKCEHKYWSRIEQRRVIPEQIPSFCVIDPFAEDYREQIRLPYPFWIKPVKSASSMLGFKVTCDAELELAIASLRRDIPQFGLPFNYMMRFAEFPAIGTPIDGHHCLVEEIISHGEQCTLEGYVYQGDVVVYGVVDSLREGLHRSSFSRYQYPSTLPQRLQQEMTGICERFLTHIGFDNGPFNVEFFCDADRDWIRLLEINPRISQSHCPLFRDVDGMSHHKVMLDLALGDKPDFPYRQGRCKVAAKCMWRLHEGDGIVTRMPTQQELDAVHQRFPDVDIHFQVREGTKLSETNEQDSYSYQVAEVYIGGDSEGELSRTFEAIKQALPLEVEPIN